MKEESERNVLKHYIKEKGLKKYVSESQSKYNQQWRILLEFVESLESEGDVELAFM